MEWKYRSKRRLLSHLYSAFYPFIFIHHIFFKWWSFQYNLFFSQTFDLETWHLFDLNVLCSTYVDSICMYTIATRSCQMIWSQCEFEFMCPGAPSEGWGGLSPVGSLERCFSCTFRGAIWGGSASVSDVPLMPPSGGVLVMERDHGEAPGRAGVICHSARLGMPWDPAKRTGGIVQGTGSLSVPAQTAVPWQCPGWMEKEGKNKLKLDVVKKKELELLHYWLALHYLYLNVCTYSKETEEK